MSIRVEPEFFSRFPPSQGKEGTIKTEVGNHDENVILLLAAQRLRDNDLGYELVGSGTVGEADSTFTLTAEERVLDVVEEVLKWQGCTKKEVIDKG